MNMIKPPSDDELKAAATRRYDLFQASKAPGQWATALSQVIEEMIKEFKSDHLIKTYGTAHGVCANSPDFQNLIDLARKKLKISDPAHGLGFLGVHMRATPYLWTAPESIPPRDWLYDRHLIRKYVSAMIAPGAVGKTAMVTTEILAMVSGKALLGVESEQLRVWYFNLEDPAEETMRRIQAAALHFGLKPDDIGDRLFVTHGREHPLVVAEMENGDAVIRWPVVHALVDEIKDKGIDVVIIDPFVSCHKVPENNNGSIDMVVKEWGKVADQADCAVLLVHHVRKGDQEVTTQSARGGGAFGDACRSVRVLNRMTEQEAKNSGVDNRRLYFSVLDDKPNLAPPAEKRDWFKLASVDLGNSPFGGGGDSVGVATRWEWPDPLDGVTGGDFERAAAAIKAGQWRANSQAKDWGGLPVAKALGLSLAVKQERAKVAGLIKIWLASGALVKVERQDERRKMKVFIEVASDDD